MNNLTLYCAFAASAAGAILNLFRKKYIFNTPTGLMALLLYTPPHHEKTRVSLLMAVAASVGAEFSLYFFVFVTSAADLTSRVTYIPVLFIGIITLAYACMSIFVLCRGAYDMVAKRREDLFNALGQFFCAYLRQGAIGVLVSECCFKPDASYETHIVNIVLVLVIHLITNFVDWMEGKKNQKIMEESSYQVASMVC